MPEQLRSDNTTLQKIWSPIRTLISLINLQSQRERDRGAQGLKSSSVAVWGAISLLSQCWCEARRPFNFQRVADDREGFGMKGGRKRGLNVDWFVQTDTSWAGVTLLWEHAHMQRNSGEHAHRVLFRLYRHGIAGSCLATEFFLNHTHYMLTWSSVNKWRRHRKDSLNGNIEGTLCKNTVKFMHMDVVAFFPYLMFLCLCYSYLQKMSK